MKRMSIALFGSPLPKLLLFIVPVKFSIFPNLLTFKVEKLLFTRIRTGYLYECHLTYEDQRFNEKLLFGFENCKYILMTLHLVCLLSVFN